ncbi:sensor histidine kinase [Enterococcus sp. CSURQ0835]|uniref:sensor histidine kinase n=1 Tax=Enterococcus sp. CSURQ0835 TaxID=2681394 RepID=UPI00135A7B3C|nr:GHKL domain-containing protein [Enterococcus sp. CSURQ0835]
MFRIINEHHLFFIFSEYVLIASANGYLLSIWLRKKYQCWIVLFSLLCVCMYSWINVFSSGIFWIGMFICTVLLTKRVVTSAFVTSFVVFTYILTNYFVGYFVEYLDLSDSSVKVFLFILLLYMIIILLIKPLVKQFIVYSNTDTRVWLIAGLSVIAVLSTLSVVVYEKIFGATTSFGHTNLFFITLYGIAFFVSSGLAAFSEKKHIEQRQKEKEQEYFQEYVKNLEITNKEIRRFKHDYQNILLAMQDYFANEDFNGLKKFYDDNLVPAMYGLEQNTLKLSKLSNVNVREVKGLILSKVLQAQGKNIEVTIEVPKEIDHFWMNSITLVRCLGIILDNAIEATEVIENSWIKIGIFNVGGTVINVIVENSTAILSQPVYHLKKEGVSTKGGNRGFGLSNLQQMISRTPNSTLETKNENGIFTQIIHIQGGAI